MKKSKTRASRHPAPADSQQRQQSKRGAANGQDGSDELFGRLTQQMMRLQRRQRWRRGRNRAALLLLVLSGAASGGYVYSQRSDVAWPQLWQRIPTFLSPTAADAIDTKDR